MLAVLGACPSLRNTAQDYAPKPDYRPLTKFENRGLRLGHGVWDLVFIKRGADEEGKAPARVPAR
jgi:tRNA (guanine-N7-)-methyltransferase